MGLANFIYGIYKDYQQNKRNEQLPELIRGIVNAPQPYQMDQSELFPGEQPIQGLQAKGNGLLDTPDKQSRLFTQLLANPEYKQIGAQGLMNMQNNQAALNKAIVTQGAASMFDNVTQDDNGMWWGIYKPTGQVMQVPMADKGFTKYKTVQSTDSRGMPVTELVSPGLLNAQNTNARITVGQKLTLPTEGEAKAISQSENAQDNLRALEELMKQPDAPSIGPTAELFRSAKTLPIINEISGALGYGYSTNDAKVTSLTTILSNQLLAAMRGAQVGPEEQKKFEKQLPMPGQDMKLFKQNLELTKKNLSDITARQAQLRGINTAPPPPPGFK